MPPHPLIILNPAAGRGAAARARPRLERLLRDHGLQFDLTCTERPGHATPLAYQAASAGCPLVVAAGGDGTVNEVINGLMQARATGRTNGSALGVLGVGRGNDFAFGVGVPLNLEAGCQALARQRRRTIDLGRATGGFFPDGRYFGNGVGIGFDAVVGFEAAKFKRLTGFAGYAAAAVRTISLYDRAPLVRVAIDGQETVQPALMVSVMNGRRLGGGFLMGPLSRPDDGVFDVCIAGQMSRAGILGLIPRFMQGTQAAHAAIRTARGRHITVTAVQGTLPAHADGETLCTDGTTLSLELLARQLDVIVAPDPAHT